jgi:peptide methionine sulfoxide reductase MsrB
VKNLAKRSEAEWKAHLSPDLYAVLRKAATCVNSLALDFEERAY